MIESMKSVDLQGLLALVDALSRVDHDVSDTERIDQLAALERVKGACAAAQAAVTVAFVTSQEKEQADRRRARRAGVDHGSGDGGSSCGGLESALREHVGRGIAGQVALARRESPTRGSAHVKLALALINELPNTYAALASGRLTEARAEIIARESAHLSGPARAGFDAELVVISRYDNADAAADSDSDSHSESDSGASGGAGVSGLGTLGDRELTRRVRALVYRADPSAAQERYEKAERARRIELRRGADAMCRLTAHLPLAQAIAANAALTAAADAARSFGDPRTKGQVMADTLVERVTGQTSADAVPVEVQLVITDESLFQEGDVPAQVPGYGTVPAAWARTLLHPDPDRTPFTQDGIDEFGGPTRYGAEFGGLVVLAPAHRFDPVDKPAPAHRFDPVDKPAPAHRFDPVDIWPQAEYPPPAPREDDPAHFHDYGRDPWGLRGDPPHRTRETQLRPVPRYDSGAPASPDHEPKAELIAEQARVWLRRLYTHPTTGQLVAMESTRRVFDGSLRRFLIARDAATCRTPWCDAPIRHLDHITDYADGGATTAANGQGLCARCNHTKNHPDWHTRILIREGAKPHTTATTTPTGHTYRSTTPPVIPGSTPTPEPLSAFERYLSQRLLTAGLRVD